jgi:hypothetical protein
VPSDRVIHSVSTTRTACGRSSRTRGSMPRG